MHTKKKGSDSAASSRFRCNQGWKCTAEFLRACYQCKNEPASDGTHFQKRDKSWNAIAPSRVENEHLKFRKSHPNLHNNQSTTRIYRLNPSTTPHYWIETTNVVGSCFFLVENTWLWCFMHWFFFMFLPMVYATPSVPNYKSLWLF